MFCPDRVIRAPRIRNGSRREPLGRVNSSYQVVRTWIALWKMVMGHPRFNHLPPPRIGDLLVQHSPLRKCREIFVGREKKNGKARPGIAHPRARILMCGLTWQGGSIRRNTGTRTIGCRNKLGLPALKN
jgi:hypothetical protein